MGNNAQDKREVARSSPNEEDPSTPIAGYGLSWFLRDTGVFKMSVSSGVGGTFFGEVFTLWLIFSSPNEGMN